MYRSTRNTIANKQKNCNLRVQPVLVQGRKVILTEINSTEAVITRTICEDQKLFIVARDVRTLACIVRTFIWLHKGEVVHFVATSRLGWYFIVKGTTSEIPAPCTCVKGLNGESCQHIDDVTAHVARQSVPQAVREAEDYITRVLREKAAKAQTEQVAC